MPRMSKKRRLEWSFFLRHEQSINEKLENWLGMEIENDNWNEGLDREWSKDMHLIQDPKAGSDAARLAPATARLRVS